MRRPGTPRAWARRRRPPGVIQAQGRAPAAGGHSRTVPGTLSRAAGKLLPANVAGVNPAMDRDSRIRARLEQHWKASEGGDAGTEHAIYAADAVLDCPQSGERFRGRPKIQAQRGGHPAQRHFTVPRIRGCGDLWVSECVITYDGVPTCAVSVMEFTGDLVTHETPVLRRPLPGACLAGGAR
jgi:hypothetical protein